LRWFLLVWNGWFIISKCGYKKYYGIRRGAKMLRNTLKLMVVLLVLMAGSLYAEPPFNVDLFCGWGGHYRPMEWTPVEVGIATTLKEPFQGKVIISAQQDALNTMNITQGITVQPDLPVHLPLVTKLAFAADKCNLRIVDNKNRTRWSHNFDLWNISRSNRSLSVVNDNDLFIGLIGSPKTGLTQLAKQSICKSGRGTGRVFLAHKLQRMTPWDWTGFASLDLLILYDPDWNIFHPEQLNAISEYVTNGGSLMVILTSKPLPAESPVGRLLPFEIQQKRKLSIDARKLQNWQLDFTEPQDVNAWPLKPKSQTRFYQAQQHDANQCVFAVGPVGFGRVGVLAFDPSELIERPDRNTSRFWTNRIARILECNQAEMENTGEFKSIERKIEDVIAKKYVPSRSAALTSDLAHADNMECGIELTIGGLEPSRYSMVSYHNNPFRRHANINVYVNGKLSSSDNPQTNVRRDDQAAKIITVFEASDGNDVKVEFRPSDSRFNQRAVLCGFQLIRLPASERTVNGETDVFAVDFGADGQDIAPGFIGLGFSVGARVKDAEFTASNGLPEGHTVVLKAIADDNLQFQPTVVRNQPNRRNPGRPERRVEKLTASSLHRTIQFVENANNYSHDGHDERMFQTGMNQVASTAVMEYLYNIPEMRPLSIWWVILILAALAILLGPVDYKILKRIDRLPLTWLTCAIWIALFTGGAYYGVQELRAGKMQLRAVSVIDAIQDSDCSWSTTYLGMFAPRSRNYRLTGIRDNHWWSATAPTEESIWAHRQDPGSRNIYCVQQDGYNKLHSAPINIWTVQCLINEAPENELPLRVDISRSGDEIALEVTNDADCPIKSGYVLFSENRLVNFQNIPPHSKSKFEKRLTRGNKWELRLMQQDQYGMMRRELSGNFVPEKAFFAQGILQRTRSINDYLEYGAAVVCAEYDNAPVPYKVKNNSCNYTHVQMARLVVFPENNDQNER
jgi:hypothetical protein